MHAAPVAVACPGGRLRAPRLAASMPTRHFLTGAELSAAELAALLDRAQQLVDEPLGSEALAGRSVALIFQKPSTRTRVSFEVGVHELGGHAVVLRSDELQLSRGEALRDTALVLSRHVAAIGLRTGPDEALEELARWSTVPVINMLSARHHPCQALADLLTLRQACGSLDGVRLAYVGDGNNVARSLAILGSLAGLHVAIASPARLRAGGGPRAAAGRERADQPAHRPARGGRRRRRRLHGRVGEHGRRGDGRSPPQRARLLPRRRRAARRGRTGRLRDARPARAPRRGDHARGPLRRRASGSGTRRRTGATRRRRCSSCWSARDRCLRAGPAPARRRARAADRLARLRRRGRRTARRGGVRRVRRRRDPRRPRARGRAQAQAQLRARPHARGAGAEPRADRPARRPSRRPVAGDPLRAPARDQARAGARGARTDRPARRLRARADRARRSNSGATATSSSTPSGRARRESWCAASTRPPAATPSCRCDDCLLASELGNRARELAAGWCAAQGLSAWERRGGGPARERAERVGPADGRSCAAAQPRRAGGPQDRAACRSGS